MFSTVAAMTGWTDLHQRTVFGRRVRVLATALADLLPAGARVLDVGCGDGSIDAAVMAQRPDVEIEGIDVLVRPTTRIPVRPYDGDTIPHDDDSFDAVTLVDVLHHTKDPAKVLGEAARVAPVVVVKDHVAGGPIDRGVLRLMDWVGNAGFGVALPYNYLSAAQWADVQRRCGLAVDRELTTLGLYPRPASWLFERDLHLVRRLCRASFPAR